MLEMPGLSPRPRRPIGRAGQEAGIKSSSVEVTSKRLFWANFGQGLIRRELAQSTKESSSTFHAHHLCWRQACLLIAMHDMEGGREVEVVPLLGAFFSPKHWSVLVDVG